MKIPEIPGGKDWGERCDSLHILSNFLISSNKHPLFKDLNGVKTIVKNVLSKLNQTSASKSRPNCRQHVPQHQQGKGSPFLKCVVSIWALSVWGGGGVGWFGALFPLRLLVGVRAARMVWGTFHVCPFRRGLKLFGQCPIARIEPTYSKKGFPLK